MHTIRGFVAAVCAVTSLCAACSPSDAGDGWGDRVGEAESSMIHPNGLQLNGLQLNGLQLNGLQLNGLQLNGMEFNGLQLNGVTLEGTMLTGTYNGEPISGSEFVGVKMTGKLSNNELLDLSVEAFHTTSDSEINEYVVTYDDGEGGAWPHLCGYDDNDDPIPAIAHPGTWDLETGTHEDTAGMFTFGCKGYAIAKCTQVGYKMWKSKPECMPSGSPCRTIELADLHQACTRAFTADYCGDGSSHTVNGTLIDIYDNIGIMPREGLQAPTFEAEWGTTGAACVANARLHSSAAEDYILANCASKWQPPGGCGGSSSTFFTENGFATPIDERVLLRNEF